MDRELVPFIQFGYSSLLEKCWLRRSKLRYRTNRLFECGAMCVRQGFLRFCELGAMDDGIAISRRDTVP